MRNSGGSILIRRSELGDAYSFRESVNEVASEKWTLATVDGFSADEITALLKRVVEERLPQVVATIDGKVIGWCDIVPRSAKGASHVGTLGMGVRKEWRRRGVGRLLLTECLALARSASFEKVELEVYSDNIPAVRLYESVGFLKEGVRVRGRKLEGRYQDIIHMAYWIDRSGGAPS